MAEFKEREFEKTSEGWYDDMGFYNTPNGSFWNPDGVYFNREGFDKYGGSYDENNIYVPGFKSEEPVEDFVEEAEFVDDGAEDEEEIVDNLNIKVDKKELDELDEDFIGNMDGIEIVKIQATKDKNYGAKPQFNDYEDYEDYGDEPYEFYKANDKRQNFGSQTYGNKPYGKQGYSNKPYENQGYGNKPYGSQGYGNKQYATKKYDNSAFVNTNEMFANKQHQTEGYGTKHFSNEGYFKKPYNKNEEYAPKQYKQNDNYGSKPYKEPYGGLSQNKNDVYTSNFITKEAKVRNAMKTLTTPCYRKINCTATRVIPIKAMLLKLTAIQDTLFKVTLPKSTVIKTMLSKNLAIKIIVSRNT